MKSFSSANGAVHTHAYVDGPAKTRVDTYTGNLHHERLDLSIPERRLSVKLLFSYNSNNKGDDSPFGFGWQWNYGIKYVQGASSIEILRGDGRSDVFTGAGPSFTPPKGLNETLFYDIVNDEYVLTTQNGNQYYMSGVEQKLYKIQDINGNTIIITYTGGKATKVQGPSGRYITLEYNGEGKLSKATFLYINGFTIPEREILYTYTNGRLEKVELKVFSSGVTIKQNDYVYNASTNLLTKIVEPDGKATFIGYAGSSGGVTILRSENKNTYFQFSTTSNQAIVSNYDGGTYQSRNTYQYAEQPASSGEIRFVGKVGGASMEWDTVSNNITKHTENGNVTDFEYDSNGNMTKETFGGASSVSYFYGTNNEITEYRNAKYNSSFPNKNKITYEYDVAGNLTLKTDFLTGTNQTSTYQYDGFGKLTRESVNLNATEFRSTLYKYEYSSLSLATKTVVSDLNNDGIQEDIGTIGVYEPGLDEPIEVYNYDKFGNKTNYTNKNAKTTSYEYDTLNRLTKVTDPVSAFETYEYNLAGKLTKDTSKKGVVTIYEYNNLNQKNKQIRDVGGLNLTTMYAYDILGKIISTTDANGKTSSYEYDSKGNKTKITDAENNVTSFAYDNTGHKTKETNARNYLTFFYYDSFGHMTKETDAMGNSINYEYDELGMKTKIKDRNGKATYYFYDELGNNTQVLKKMGLDNGNSIDADDIFTDFEYDLVGNKTRECAPRKSAEAQECFTYEYDTNSKMTKMTNPLNEITNFTYNPGGEQKSEESPSSHVVTTTYDDLGRVINITDNVGGTPGVFVVSYEYDNVGNKTKETGESGGIRNYFYDNANRKTEERDPAGISTYYEYDNMGNMTKETNREGKVTNRYYNSLNHLTKVTKDPIGLNTNVSFFFDAVGNTTKIIDESNNAKNYFYDALNRITRMESADGENQYLTYDNTNKVISRTDQNGQITTYEYDDLYNGTKVNFPGENDRTFSYDSRGRMTLAANLDATLGFAYDKTNRIKQEAQNYGTLRTVDYLYNTPSRLRTVTYPGGKVIQETKDERSRMLYIDDTTSGSINIASYVYTSGVLASMTHSDALWDSSFTNNINDWTTNITHNLPGVDDPTFDYGFDYEGNIKYSKRQHDSSNSNQYIYDNLDRLTDYRVGTLNASNAIPVPPPPGIQQTYSFDTSGNWTTFTVNNNGTITTENRIANAVNEYTDVGGTVYSYDKNGNLKNDGLYTYSYDYENNLTKVIGGAVNVEYKYGPLGKRIEKNNIGTGVVTKYYYSGRNCIEEWVGGSITAAYTYGSGFDNVLTMERGGTTYYYHHSFLGSVDTLTDASGNIVERYWYDAYGNPTVYDATWTELLIPSSWVGNPYMFTGRRYDEEIGLYYYRARTYSGKLGRFLQIDKLGNIDGTNLYEYVSGNPVKNIDPGGNQRLNVVGNILMQTGWTNWFPFPFPFVFWGSTGFLIPGAGYTPVRQFEATVDYAMTGGGIRIIRTRVNGRDGDNQAVPSRNWWQRSRRWGIPLPVVPLPPPSPWGAFGGFNANIPTDFRLGTNLTLGRISAFNGQAGCFTLNLTGAFSEQSIGRLGWWGGTWSYRRVRLMRASIIVCGGGSFGVPAVTIGVAPYSPIFFRYNMNATANIIPALPDIFGASPFFW